MNSIIVISIFIIFLMGTYIVLLKKQIRDMIQQLKFINTHKTNMVLNTKVMQTKEIQELTIQMNELIEEHRQLEIDLQKTNRTFKETITNVSHDLRTPLTSANGYLQLVKDDNTPKEKKKEYIRIMEEKITSVKEMLEQLFEYARIEAEEYKLKQKKICINIILIDTISEFYQDFSQKGIEPNIQMVEEMLYINGDEKALKRVFQNLIGNALVHGEGNITISLEKQNDKKIISFSNTTKTIEEQDINKLFERFYTTDKSRSKKTTGLGLSIAKQFVTQMHGEIQAQLTENQFSILIQF